MRGGEWAVAATVGWALMFGDPKTDGVGWKELDVFESQTSCVQDRQERGREVRDKTTTDQPLEAVLRFYRCVQKQ